MRSRRRKSYDAFGREVNRPGKSKPQRPSLHEVAMRGGMRGVTPPSGRPTQPPPKPGGLVQWGPPPRWAGHGDHAPIIAPPPKPVPGQERIGRPTPPARMYYDWEKRP